MVLMEYKIANGQSKLLKKLKYIDKYHSNDTTDIYIVRNMDDQETYVLKVIHKYRLLYPIKLIEHKIHSKLNNYRHIVKLLCFDEDKNYCYLLMEHSKSRDLFEVIYNCKRLSEGNARFIFKQIIKAIQYCDFMNIIHADIKPENILVFEDAKSIHYGDQKYFNLLDCTFKLCDFGHSYYYRKDKPCTRVKGTLEYSAPEAIFGNPHTIKSDIWALGVLLYELLYGYSPFSRRTREEMYYAIKNRRLYFPEKPLISKQARSLISDCLSYYPQNRPSIRELIVHPWVNFKDSFFSKGRESPPPRRKRSNSIH